MGESILYTSIAWPMPQNEKTITNQYFVGVNSVPFLSSVSRFILLTYVSFEDGAKNTICGNQWHGKCWLNSILGQEMGDDYIPQSLYK